MDWVQIQSDTFVKWVNLELKEAQQPEIANLKTDLRDGTKLVRLVEQVIGKPFTGKVRDSPKGKLQEMENLNAAFKFMEENEVKLVNVGASDVHDGHLKLILGLLWTLISKFAIVHRLKPGDTKSSAKQLLLDFINSKVGKTGLVVKNFRSDWRDGKVLAALTNAMANEVYGSPDKVVSVLSYSTPRELVTATMSAAENKLCVAPLLSADQFTSDSCDEHSMMAYVSLFCDACKPDERKSEPSPAAAAVAAPPVAVQPKSDRVPPLERSPDWRVYEGHNLGGRCRIRVYFSTTTHSKIIRKNTEALQRMFESLMIQKRDDFEPWIPLDMDMDKALRDKIFEKAGTRESPLVFVDDEYIGGYDKVAELHNDGAFMKILDY